MRSAFQEARNATRSGAHDRKTGGHGLQNGEGISFVVGAEHKDIRCAQHVRNIAPQPEKANTAGQAETVRLRFQLRAQGSVSDQEQTSVRMGGRTTGERTEEQRVIFLRCKAGHADKQNMALMETLSCAP